MDKHIIKFSLKYRFFVVLSCLAIIGVGTYEYFRLPVDAFPDISPVMVPVFAEAHGMAPQEVERLITFPIESVMSGLPQVTEIKSTSAFGLSAVYVYFEDNVDIYFARQIVSERLSEAASRLPQLHEPPSLGPISTGLGQIFIYYLKSNDDIDTDGKDLQSYLREVNDYIVKYQLQGVSGVTDILSIGGYVPQYQIEIDPTALSKYRIPLKVVIEAVQQNNRNVGGQFIVASNEEYLVRAIGLLQTLDDIKDIQIKRDGDISIKISDVADVKYSREIRRGVVSRNGEQEVVSGIVMQLYGENTSNVIKELYKKIPAVQKSLPQGVELVPYYEQAELVEKALWTVKEALLIGAALIIVVLFCFLGNLRSAFIVTLSLPLCAFIAVICMRITNISANLMSLGGIAIAVGLLCDGTIIMVENIFRHLNTNKADTLEKKTEIILNSAKEVARPIIFSILIVVVVFIPLFTLQGVEGKMFIPMALTLCFALLGSLVVAVVMAPALCTYILKASPHKIFFLLHWLNCLYKPILKFAVNRKAVVLILVIALLAAGGYCLPKLGTEFIPTLEEGAILIGVVMSPSTSLEKATEIVQTLERKIIKYDDVREVVSRIGRPEAGSHPHPVNYAEIQIELKTYDYDKKKELVANLDEELSTYPGVVLNFTQPIQNAFDELLSGIKAQVAIKIFGEDLNILKSKADEIYNSIEGIEALVDLSTEQSFGQPQIQIIPDRKACGFYGINISDVFELVEYAIGGEAIDNIYINTRQYAINVRYKEQYRSSRQAIEDLLISTDSGAAIALKQVAEVKEVMGPMQINREKNQRRWIVQGNVRGSDLGSVIEQIRETIEQNVVLPDGYYVEYGGQFENQQRAMARLMIIVPIVLSLIFVLLWLAFGSFGNAVLVIINLPIAMTGGIAGLLIMNQYLSVPAAVGFIALFGIATQDSIVLISCINSRVQSGMRIKDAIINGAILRLRPVLITAITTILGLLPLLMSNGIGAEVQKPLASVVVFGLTTSTILTLIVIPAFYPWFAAKKD